MYVICYIRWVFQGLIKVSTGSEEICFKMNEGKKRGSAVHHNSAIAAFHILECQHIHSPNSISVFYCYKS